MAMSSLTRFVLAACAAFFPFSGTRAAPIISGDYYEEGALATCNNANFCERNSRPFRQGRKC